MSTAKPQHEQGPLYLKARFDCDYETLLVSDIDEVVADTLRLLITSGPNRKAGMARAQKNLQNAQRLAACWNAFVGVPTEKIQSLGVYATNDQVTALTAALEAAVAALKPFADDGKRIDKMWSDERRRSSLSNDKPLLVSHYRAALQASTAGQTVLDHVKVATPVANPGKVVDLNVIRNWPEGFDEDLHEIWDVVLGYTSNFKLYELQQKLFEYGFTMVVYEPVTQTRKEQTNV